MSIHSPESTLIFAFQILNISIKSSRPVGIVIQNKFDLNSFHSSEGKFIDLVAYNVCFIMPNVFARKPGLYFLMSSDLSNFQQLWQRPNFQSLGPGSCDRKTFQMEIDAGVLLNVHPVENYFCIKTKTDLFCMRPRRVLLIQLFLCKSEK